MTGYLCITESRGNFKVTSSEHLAYDLGQMHMQDPHMGIVRVYEFSDKESIDTLIHGGQETRKILRGWMIDHGEPASVDDLCGLWGGKRLAQYESRSY